MKKFSALLIALSMFFLAACGEKIPDTYEYYTGFTPECQEVIPQRDETGYTDITDDSHGQYFRNEMGMDSLLSHRIMNTKTAVIANFYVSEASQIQLIRNYAYETFWQGKLHFITGGLPYEDWQHKTHIKNLCVQIWEVGGENILIQDTYTFDQLELSGFKAFDLSTKTNESYVFSDQYIKLDQLLNSDRDYAHRWLDIEQWTGKEYVIDLHTSLLADRLNIDIYTPKQLPPQNLAPLYKQLYEKLNAIDTDITVHLYRGENSVNYTEYYFCYSSAEGLPAAEEAQK